MKNNLGLMAASVLMMGAHHPGTIRSTERVYYRENRPKKPKQTPKVNKNRSKAKAARQARKRNRR